MLSSASKPENKPQTSESSENQPKIPSISLPKGGGAIRGIGEKFAANPVTGTGSFSVPIFTSPGRSGFGPQLSLSYDSGSGNGPFGFGWNLSLPSITRKTDKGLPRYQDADESDTFILSGAEDLVPILVFKNGKWQREPLNSEDGTFQIQRYLPRIEGLFARVERWTRLDNGDIHWRSISKDNILTIYGKDKQSRICDPADESRIFSWLICEIREDKGNAIVYEYKQEDGTDVDLSQVHERNRGEHQDNCRTTNRYLKRIKYGNCEPILNGEGQGAQILSQKQIKDAVWMFEVVFDYDDHDPTSPKPSDDSATDAIGTLRYPWKRRQDPFSSYRSGFEVRTYRLCQRVLMFHHFPGEDGVGPDCLVHSTDFKYSYEKNPIDAINPIYSFLLSVQQTGYKRATGSSYLSKSLPPIEFEYSMPIINDIVEEVDSASLENLPIGIDGMIYQWTDLHGEGIPGILTEQGGAWFYKRNLSPIPVKQGDGQEQVKIQFAPIEMVALRPNLAIASGAQFMDLAGDGQPDLVVLDGLTPGLYEHDDEEGWQPFRPFSSRLNRNTHDPNLKFVDLDGDGHADVLITEDDALVWHASLAEEGFGPANRVVQALDEEKSPRLIFADGTQSIYLADMSGDGLTDLVRIRNGEVCYWPNLGYCRFGSKVTMDMPIDTDLSPYFDNPDQFDQKRIRLADIDGSGTTDIIYLHRDGVRLYFNQSGNSWSAPKLLKVLPRVDDIVSIVPIDLLGNGTACLVWSSTLPGDSCKPMRYVNLMGGQKPDLQAEQQDRTIQKPHILTLVRNNLGAETHVYYAPSTKFYLQDKRDGMPWITRLPFPVHVVERVETYDRISRNRFVTRYAYHHGYFDGEEREFRGFGMVEQWDTEKIGTVHKEHNSALDVNLDSASFVPPIHTKTWFHTGAYQEADKISQHFAHEYYGAPKKKDADYDKKWKSFEANLLPDTIPLPELTPSEEREAYRALKGSMLRQEIYSDDALPGAKNEVVERASNPYTVTEQNFTIRLVQPQSVNRHAVFFTHAREAINYHYERNPDDPRITHSLTLDVDNFGNVLRSITVGYPRANVPERQPEQNETHLTLTLNRFTNRDENPDWRRIGTPVEARTYEVVKPPATELRFSWDELYDLSKALIPLDKSEPSFDKTIPYEQWDWRKHWNPQAEPGGLVNGELPYIRLRLIEHVRTFYRPNDLGASKNDTHALLSLGTVESFALPGESYKLAFTPGLVNEFYGKRVTDAMLETEGRYVHSEGDKNWWIPSGKVFYSPKEDDTPDDELTAACKHFFLPRRFCDPFGNNTIMNYDSNENDPSKNYDLLLTETHDALGNIVTAENDYRVLQPKLITDPNDNRSEVRFDALGMVVGTAVMGKGSGSIEGDSFATFTSDLTPQEIEDYFDAADPRLLAIDHLGTATTRVIYDLDRVPSCAATIARETHVSDLNGQQTRVQLSFSYSDGFGREIQKKIQAESVLVNDKKGDPRWVGSGWTIFNNKGKPIRQYEPFFTNTHQFEFDVRLGVSPVLFYDSVERVVVTLHPNHTYEKVVFDPWHQKTYDVNDTVKSDPRTDEDIRSYVMGYFATQSSTWQTWYQQRIGLPQGNSEREAAEKSAVHNDTPSTAYFDSLGRTFLTVADNSSYGKYETRVEIDIEGNQRAVIDALNRTVMQYDYDMLGNRIKQDSMDAGIRWMLGNVTGNPIYGWDSRDHTIRHVYDQLHRQTHLYVQFESNPEEELAERTIYGEIHPDSNPSPEGNPAPLSLNLRGKVFLQLDGAGVIINCVKFSKSDADSNTEKYEAYDFKGNLLRSVRRIAKEYHKCPNWKDVEDKLTKYIKDQLNKNLLETDDLEAFLSYVYSLQEPEEFTSSTKYDALNRPVTLTTPDNSIISPIYNEANHLESLSVNLRGADNPTQFIKNIDYNAKGQRELIEYGNNVITEYEYDPQTFRLMNLFTTRGTQFPTDCSSKQPCSNPPKNCSKPRKLVCGVQNLHYTYDPSGNITHIRDDAQQPIYFSNSIMQPESDYTYDAIYRLIQAKGREHIGSAETPWPTWDDRGLTSLPQPGNPEQMRNYVEKYFYDSVGNFDSIQHWACNGNGTNQNNWTRTFTIDPDSSDPNKKQSNRLTECKVGNQTGTFTYDSHGNMTFMPHLPTMAWDFKDQLQCVDKSKKNDGNIGCKVYLTYDASGQRVRKVMEQNGKLLNERIYIGGYEIYRKYNGNNSNPVIERESLHIMDDKQRIALVDTKTIDINCDPKKLSETLIRYQFSNHLGSAVLELDEYADVISYEEYYPYGSTSYQAVRSKKPGSVEVSTKRYRYIGKERDEETGLYYHGARYYAPWLGRWVSCDPGGLVDGTNVYSYAHNNPSMFLDSTGLQTDKEQSQDEGISGWKDMSLFEQVWEGYKIYANEELPKMQANWDAAFPVEYEAEKKNLMDKALGEQRDGGLEAGETEKKDLQEWVESKAYENVIKKIGKRPENVIFTLIKEYLEFLVFRKLASSGKTPSEAPPTGRTLNVGGELESKPGDIVVNRPETAQVSLQTIAKDTKAYVIAGRAEELPIKTSSISSYEAHNLPPRVIDWSKAAPEAARVLKPGGTIDITVRGGADEIAAALQKAGLKAIVDPMSMGTRVIGFKPYMSTTW